MKIRQCYGIQISLQTHDSSEILAKLDQNFDLLTPPTRAMIISQKFHDPSTLARTISKTMDKTT